MAKNMNNRLLNLEDTTKRNSILETVESPLVIMSEDSESSYRKLVREISKEPNPEKYLDKQFEEYEGIKNSLYHPDNNLFIQKGISLDNVLLYQPSKLNYIAN